MFNVFISIISFGWQWHHVSDDRRMLVYATAGRSVSVRETVPTLCRLSDNNYFHTGTPAGTAM